MYRRTAIRAALAALTLTAAVACSGSPADEGTGRANPTLATDPPSTTPTDPYTVPTVIDIAYVTRIIAGLDSAMGTVTRLVLQTRTIPREAYDRMRAIYGTDDGIQLAIDPFQSDIQRSFAGYRTEPGNKSTTIQELISATSSCVYARVTRDYSAVGTNARTADIQWIAIRPSQAARDPHGYNSTNWAFAYEGFPPDRTQPPNPCH